MTGPDTTARALPLLALCCALAVLAGCSTGNSVGTAKTTSARSTVPADNNVGQTESASANANFAEDKLRLIDPCGLLDTPTMAQFGTAQRADAAGIDSCDDDISDGKGNDLNLTVTIGTDLSEYSPTGTIAGLPTAENSDDSACFERIITQHNPMIGIEIQSDYEKNDSCLPARQLAQLVITRIRTNPPQRAAGGGSLFTVDPCGTVDDATAAAVVGGKATKQSDGLYRCEWQNDTDSYNLTVDFGLDEDPKNDTTSGTPQPVDIGVPAYQSSSNDVFPTCDVKWMTHSTGNGYGDVVDVEFGNVASGSVDVCAQAVTAAKAVAAKVPKAS